MPRIFDCFIFFNENDVLDIRFQELAPVVDQFIIVQASQTFRGKEKPDFFDYERFEKYKGQYQLFTLPALPGKTTWEREVFQRNFIADILSTIVGWNDTIIISDVDEIPRRSIVKPVQEHMRLRLDKYSYAINMLTNEGNTVARMLRYRDIDASIEEIRRGHNGKMVDNAGWEFSSLGTPETIMEKFKAFSHDEFDHVISIDSFKKQIANGQDLLGRDIAMTPVEIDDTFPEAIKNDPEFWSKYLWT